MPGRATRGPQDGQDGQDGQGERPVGDELYDVAPSEFVAARTALVRELRARGDRAVAADVAARRRPSRSAWALNQVARQEPGLIDAYLDAVAALRIATEQALEGDPTAVRPAQADERAAIDEAMAAAARHLDRVGDATTPALVQRMTDSLRAAGADDEAAAVVRAGRLTEDLEPSSFGLGGFGLTPTGRADRRPGRSAPASVAKADREQARHAQLEQAARDAEQMAAQLRSEADAARGEADRAEAAAKLARKTADTADRRAEAAQRKAERARAKVGPRR